MIILYPGYHKHWKGCSKLILGTALKSGFVKIFFNVDRRNLK